MKCNKNVPIIQHIDSIETEVPNVVAIEL